MQSCTTCDVMVKRPRRLIPLCLLQTQTHSPPMATQLIQTHLSDAEVFRGDELCKQKSLQLLQEFQLPNGLLPLQDISEVGFSRKDGFVWVKQKKATVHLFKSIGKSVSYGQEITAYVEKQRMRKLTGVKTKEFLFWITIGDIYVDDKDSDKLAFRNPQTGISKSFPISAFQVEENK